MDARQRDSTGVPGHMHCLLCCVLSGCAVDCAIATPAVCVLQNFLKREFRPKSCLSADTQGQFAAMSKRLYYPDAAHRCSAKGSDGHQADWAGTYDRDIFACSNRCEAKRMQSNRERLGECCFCKRHAVGDGSKVGGGQIDALTEKAGVVRIAEEANVCADIMVASQTELAMITIAGRFKCSAIANGESRHALTEPHDCS